MEIPMPLLIDLRWHVGVDVHRRDAYGVCRAYYTLIMTDSNGSLP